MSRFYIKYSDTDFYVGHAVVGEPVFTQREGKWYDKDGKEVQVEVLSLEEMFRRVTDNGDEGKL